MSELSDAWKSTEARQAGCPHGNVVTATSWVPAHSSFEENATCGDCGKFLWVRMAPDPDGVAVEPKQIPTVPDGAFDAPEKVLAARRVLCRARAARSWDCPARDEDFDGDAERAGFAALRDGGWFNPCGDGSWAAGDALVAAIVAADQQAGADEARRRKAERAAAGEAWTRVQLDLLARLVGRRIAAVEYLRLSDFDPESGRVDAACRLRLDDGSTIRGTDDGEFRFDPAAPPAPTEQGVGP